MPETATRWIYVRSSLYRRECAVCGGEIGACTPHRAEPRDDFPRYVHVRCEHLPIPPRTAPAPPPF